MIFCFFLIGCVQDSYEKVRSDIPNSDSLKVQKKKWRHFDFEKDWNIPFGGEECLEGDFSFLKFKRVSSSFIKRIVGENFRKYLTSNSIHSKVFDKDRTTMFFCQLSKARYLFYEGIGYGYDDDDGKGVIFIFENGKFFNLKIPSRVESNIFKVYSSSKAIKFSMHFSTGGMYSIELIFCGDSFYTVKRSIIDRNENYKF